MGPELRDSQLIKKKKTQKPSVQFIKGLRDVKSRRPGSELLKGDTETDLGEVELTETRKLKFYS